MHIPWWNDSFLASLTKTAGIKKERRRPADPFRARLWLEHLEDRVVLSPGTGPFFTLTPTLTGSEGSIVNLQLSIENLNQISSGNSTLSGLSSFNVEISIPTTTFTVSTTGSGYYLGIPRLPTGQHCW